MLRTRDRTKRLASIKNSKLKIQNSAKNSPSASGNRSDLWEHWKQLCVQVVFLGVISGAIALSYSSAKMGLQAIVNPDASLWLPAYLPAWARIPVSHEATPQTLPDLRRSLQAQGFAVGEAVPLVATGDSRQPDIALPLFPDPDTCSRTCQNLLEVRVYQAVAPANAPQPSRTYFRQVERVEVEGPAESFAIAPLANHLSGRAGSNRPLPLKALQRFSGEVPNDGGVWLNLVGDRTEGQTHLVYGQIYRYHPQRQHLGQMLQWTSPEGQLPGWQNLTGDGDLELLVDRSVGLEPDFEIYQLRSRDFLPNPVRLSAVSLAEPIIEDRAYKDALLLARRRLWSPAFDTMQAVIDSYDRNGRSFPMAARAQFDVIQLHAQVADAQAGASRASPAQQVLADLIDGRWKEALEAFEAADDRTEIVELLRSDSGRLRQRIETALRIDPYNFEALVWEMLVVTAQSDRASALEQLEKRTDVPTEWKASLRQWIEAL